jgi:nitrogen fixation protein FixH
MTRTQKTFLAFAVLIIATMTAATVIVGSKVREETVVEHPYEARQAFEAKRAAQGQAAAAAPAQKPCDLGAAPCSAAVAGGTVTLELSPRPLRTMSDLRVRAVVAGVEPAAVSVSFAMPGMKMGDNVSRLARTGGAWEGKAVLVRCPSGRKNWEADVKLERPGAEPLHAVLPITVAE